MRFDHLSTGQSTKNEGEESIWKPEALHDRAAFIENVPIPGGSDTAFSRPNGSSACHAMEKNM